MDKFLGLVTSRLDRVLINEEEKERVEIEIVTFPRNFGKLFLKTRN